DDPNENGKDDTIGWTERGEGLFGFNIVASWFGVPNQWGEKDGKLQPMFMFSEYMDTLDFVKKLRNKGYINKDFPATSKDDQQNMFENGKAGAYVGTLTDVGGMHETAEEIDPDAEYD